jgi:serine/threonine protein kinase
MQSNQIMQAAPQTGGINQ